MLKKLTTYLKLTQQMGFRYMVFRAWYELQKKTGLLQRKFPTVTNEVILPTLKEWKINQKSFFQCNLENLAKLDTDEFEILKRRVARFKEGEIELFGGKAYQVPLEEWNLNPLTGFKYSNTLHWSKISEFTKEAGDIKYVWEKARFSWVYSFIRYDQYSSQDSSKFVFDTIWSFIDNNPINQGPNYICSQEISLRVLNWTFALYYYKDSMALDQNIFDKIMESINAQITHVYSNINFSRIAVRNNHAITETLTLFLIGLLFPFLPEAKTWKTKGKKWFEEEIEYQIYEDGSYLQYSMNYHRVVVQLLNWAITLSENNGENLAPIVYSRAKKTVEFLEGCQDSISGQLPHYGANDGALFFPFNSLIYRNYRPQLNALKTSLRMPLEDAEGMLEDCFWLGLKPQIEKSITNQQINKSTKRTISNQFTSGGYYVNKDASSLTFIRCGSHKSRPSQADNLHLDIWVNGQNILRDSGTYLYNGNTEEVGYYNSTKAHNVVQIENEDQMRRGARFIWFDWTQAIHANVEETEVYWCFNGTIKAFNSLEVKRKVTKHKHNLVWEIEDEILGKPKGKLMHQNWHPNFSKELNVSISCKDANGDSAYSNETDGWYAPNYGESIKSPILTFSTKGNYLCTRIEVNS